MNKAVTYRSIFYKDMLEEEDYINIDKDDLHDENHIWIHDTFPIKYFADFNKYSYIEFKNRVKTYLNE